MNADPVRVNRIDLLAALPALRLVQSVPLGTGLQTLVPSAIAVLLVAAIHALLPGEVRLASPESADIAMAGPVGHIIGDFAVIVRGASFGLLVRLFLTVFVLTCCGTAVARAVGLSVCRGTRAGAWRAIRHVVRNVRAIIVSVVLTALLTGLAILMFRVSLWISGVVANTGAGESIHDALAWCTALMLVLVTAVCTTGWMWSWSAIGVDSVSGAEALSRGISYVLTKFWVTIAFVVFGLGMAMLTGFLAELCSRAAYQMIAPSAVPGAIVDSRSATTCAAILVDTISLSVFLSGLTIGYLVLRQIVDGVSPDEIDGGSTGIST